MRGEYVLYYFNQIGRDERRSQRSRDGGTCALQSQNRVFPAMRGAGDFVWDIGYENTENRGAILQTGAGSGSLDGATSRDECHKRHPGSSPYSALQPLSTVLSCFAPRFCICTLGRWRTAPETRTQRLTPPRWGARRAVAPRGDSAVAADAASRAPAQL